MKKIGYTILVLLIFQTIGYVSIAKSYLIESAISNKIIYIDLEPFQNINVYSNHSISDKNKNILKQKCENKNLSYFYIDNIEAIPRFDRFHKRDLTYAIELNLYFPFATADVENSTDGYGDQEVNLYVWVLVKWVKVKYLYGGQS